MLAGAELRIKGKGNGEVLVMTGKPLGQKVSVGGSFVMETAGEIDQAQRDYQNGAFGIPWDHKAGEEEWREKVEVGKRIRGRI